MKVQKYVKTADEKRIVHRFFPSEKTSTHENMI